jgi:hypothetical protein
MLYLGKIRKINMTDINIEDINEADIIKLLSHYDITVSDIDIDEDNNSANVYIEVNAIGIYTIDWIETILKKLRTIQDELVKEGLIHDISLYDLYQGTWRISINFKTADEAKQQLVL